MPDFEISDALKLYLQDKKTASTVDTLVVNLDNPTYTDMDREKLLNLNEGIVLACQVRADLVAFMAHLWGCSFGAAITKDHKLSEVFSGESIKDFWDNKYYWSYICDSGGEELDGRHFDATVDIDEKLKKVSLICWLWDGDDNKELWRKIKVPSGWKREIDDDGAFYLESGPLSIHDMLTNTDETITHLSKLAEDIVAVLSPWLRKR